MEQKVGAEARAKVRDLVKDINIAMLSTRGEDGHFHARPMGTSKAEFDGTLWFLTDKRTAKVDELTRDPEVHVTYSDASKQNYVSLSGSGTIVTDRATIKELWSEPARAWFPKGVDDPDLVAMRVDIEIAEYWDSPSGTLVMAYGYAKAILTGKREENDIGEQGVARY